MIQIYEYQVEYIEPYGNIESILRRLSVQGWRLILCRGDDTLVFERPKMITDAQESESQSQENWPERSVELARINR